MRALRLLPACALLITVSGCMGWKWVPPPVTAPDGTPARFDLARITRANGALEELRDVQVTADSVTGTRITADGRGERVSLPRAEVVVVERQSVNVFATALAAAAAAAVGIFVLFMQAVSAA
ncbi:MAG TPA: hypothetical protein VFR37_10385 [Longimicrobium sp.]|nr:hypothetical protein [Longimicrobium sp.]